MGLWVTHKLNPKPSPPTNDKHNQSYLSSSEDFEP
jgi:hypothetical protein